MPAATAQPRATPQRIRRGRTISRLLGALLILIAALLLLPYLLVPLYRFVNPISTLMLWRWAHGQRVERSFVPVERMAPSLPVTVIAAEDGRYCLHSGIDWQEIEDRLEDVDDIGAAKGVSTITQQTAKNLFLWPGRSFLRKALELPLALWMNLVLPKWRVLEIYLNIAEWGPSGQFGAEAASRYAFNKSVRALGPREAALLAAVLPNPHRRSAKAPGPVVRRLAAIYVTRAIAQSSLAACATPASARRFSLSAPPFSCDGDNFCVVGERHVSSRFAEMRGAVVRQRTQKEAGAYYTPDAVVRTLLEWVVRYPDDRLIDPACGDGRFIAGHRNTVGIEQDNLAVRLARMRAPWALVHEGDFFTWAARVTERFECAAGNPPFIRYQHFTGETRARALDLCTRLGANFTRLTSSWAPFLAAVAGVLKPGGRLAFVVPAEIGHAPYAAPLLEYLVQRFALVHVVAVREKFFPSLSEDCWLLYTEGFSGRTEQIRFTVQERFVPSTTPPSQFIQISVAEWRGIWNRRLRPFLLDPDARKLYRDIAVLPTARRFGDLVTVGIGYVSGANEFFHLRPSEAHKFDIPHQFLHPTVRNGRALTSSRLTQAIVDGWKRDDNPILLLKIPKMAELPHQVRRYLELDCAQAARRAYKCRMRDPWYSVPDVQVPDFFLTYMSGLQPVLVRNDAGCTCTNSVHAVRIKNSPEARDHLRSWGSDFVRLSCEIEGHPLGGGLLKMEPREAAQIVFPPPSVAKELSPTLLSEAIGTMRLWRHYDSST